MKQCENCGNEHDGTYGSGRFCSIKCSRGFSTKAKRKEINEKISKLYPKIKLECKCCGEIFEIKNSKKHQKTCSYSCASKLRNSTPEAKEKISKHFSELAKKRYNAGDITIGWQNRKNMPLSKPEQIVKLWLEEYSIIFEREYKQGKYFIDFAILSKKIALEIDGKQHNYNDRIIKDKQKDEHLKSLGWNVIRYPFIDYKDLQKKKKEIIALLV